jgi:hypothetical protein
LIAKGGQSGSPTLTTTESVSIVRADEKLTAFLELEAVIRGGWPLTAAIR